MANVVIMHYTCPNDPRRDWALWSAPLFSLIDEGAKAYAVYKGASGSGGGGSGGNNVPGSAAQNSNTGQQSGSSSPSPGPAK